MKDHYTSSEPLLSSIFGRLSGLSGDIVLFLYSERSGNPLGRHFFEQAGSSKQSVAWKLISLLVIFFYLFTVCGLEWCFVVLGGKLWEEKQWL